MAKRRGGFTLVEVLVCLALMIMLAGLLPLLRHNAPSKAGTRAAAETLAQAIRSAQSRSVLHQTPVALAIPTQQGARSYSQAYYLLEGFSGPRVSEVDWLDDSHQLMLSCPTWSSDSVFSPDTSAQSAAGFNLTQWAPPYPQDQLLVLLPTGRVTSNGLPLLNGSYHFVVGQNLSLQGFQLNGCGEACTVTVTPLGQVLVDSGVLGATALTPPTGSSQVAASAPAVDPIPQQIPIISNITISPSSADLTPPPGVQAMLQRDQFLSLTVNATSPQGVPLFCCWNATGGNFSCPSSQQPMSWDSSAQLWTSSWQWQPGPDDTDINYTAICNVCDAWNNTATNVVNSQVLLQVQPRKPRMLAVAQVSGLYELCTAFMDGTGQQVITRNSPIKNSAASLSPDGTKTAGIYKGGGADSITIRAIQGGIISQIPLSVLADSTTPPVWSPNGARLAYCAGDDIWVCNADGSQQINITNTPGAVEALSVYTGLNVAYPLDDGVWSPDGSSIIFHRFDSGAAPNGNNSLYFVAVQATQTAQSALTPQLLAPSSQAARVSWSPDGSKIVYDQNYGGLTMIDAPPASPNPHAVGGSYEMCPHFSSDGSSLICSQGLLAPAELVSPADSRTTSVFTIPNDNGEVFSPLWADDSDVSYMRGLGGAQALVEAFPTGGGNRFTIFPVPSGGNDIHVMSWSH